jgi:hypothetical protein
LFNLFNDGLIPSWVSECGKPVAHLLYIAANRLLCPELLVIHALDKQFSCVSSALNKQPGAPFLSTKLNAFTISTCNAS